MAQAGTFQGDVTIQGNATITGSLYPARNRTAMLQEDNAVYPIPLTWFRIHDAIQTNLTTAGNDDLGIGSGTLGSVSPTLNAGDLKAAGATTRYARVQIPLPVEYVAGQTVTIRVNAGMATTVADTSCTIDVQAYLVAGDSTEGADICATAAQSMNSLTFAEKSFTITPTTLSPGDLLDVRLAIACNDAATGTAVTPTIGEVALVCDIQG